MDNTDPYSPARMADRMAIQDIMYKWARSVDRLDLDTIRTLFHPSAKDDHGPYKGDVEGLIAWIRERHKGITFSMHSLSNILIEFAGPDVALVESTIINIQRYPPEGKASLAQLSGGKTGKPGWGIDMMGSSRYVDKFERRGGAWKISERTCVMGWRTMMDVDPEGPQMLPNWHVQKRDGTDFIFRQRAELGIAP